MHEHEIINMENKNSVPISLWFECPLIYTHMFEKSDPQLFLSVCGEWDLYLDLSDHMNNIRIKQLIVDSEALVTMFSLCLMDLSYLILKETTADHRTVRTQHIVETTHNDDEF